MLACERSHQTVKLAPVGHALMENRTGLVTDAMLTQATGMAEYEAAETMAARRIHKKGRKAGHTALACNIAYLNLTRQNYFITLKR